MPTLSVSLEREREGKTIHNKMTSTVRKRLPRGANARWLQNEDNKNNDKNNQDKDKNNEDVDKNNDKLQETSPPTKAPSVSPARKPTPNPTPSGTLEPTISPSPTTSQLPETIGRQSLFLSTLGVSDIDFTLLQSDLLKVLEAGLCSVNLRLIADQGVDECPARTTTPKDTTAVWRYPKVETQGIILTNIEYLTWNITYNVIEWGYQTGESRLSRVCWIVCYHTHRVWLERRLRRFWECRIRFLMTLQYRFNRLDWLCW